MSQTLDNKSSFPGWWQISNDAGGAASGGISRASTDKEKFLKLKLCDNSEPSTEKSFYFIYAFFPLPSEHSLETCFLFSGLYVSSLFCKRQFVIWEMRKCSIVSALVRCISFFLFLPCSSVISANSYLFFFPCNMFSISIATHPFGLSNQMSSQPLSRHFFQRKIMI